MLAGKPMFTAVAALSLALGIGLNTAIFTLIHTILWGAVPYREPDRIVAIRSAPPGHPDQLNGVSVPDYLAFQRRNRSFESLGAMEDFTRDLGSDLFAFAATALAAVGIYGILAVAVEQRTRMALGARAGDVLRRMLRQALWMILAGVAFGFAGSMGLSRVISSNLWEVQSADPLTFACAAALLAAVALAASIVPARRAARLDPSIALRSE